MVAAVGYRPSDAPFLYPSGLCLTDAASLIQRGHLRRPPSGSGCNVLCFQAGRDAGHVLAWPSDSAVIACKSRLAGPSNLQVSIHWSQHLRNTLVPVIASPTGPSMQSVPQQFA